MFQNTAHRWATARCNCLNIISIENEDTCFLALLIAASIAGLVGGWLCSGCRHDFS